MIYSLSLLCSNLYARFLLLLVLFSVIAVPSVTAQISISTTSGFSNSETVNTVTFNFQNTNAYPVVITNIEGIASQYGTVSVELWYKPSAITAAPGQINAANGWTQAATQSVNGIANTSTTATQPLLTGISLSIPANSTYGIAIAASSGGAGVLRIGTAATNVTVSAGNCSFLSGPNIGFAATGLPPAAPTLTQKEWLGKITFVPGMSCNAAPAAATVSGPANICSGALFSLSATGYSVSTNISHQWQQYNNTTSSWQDIATATDPSAYTNSDGITASTQYRLKSTCISSGTSNFSSAITVNIGTGLLGGTYTINKNAPSSATNFISFNAAAAAMKCGITGLVNLNVVPGSGPYTEHVTFGNIPGASAVNQIRLNGNGEILQYDSVDLGINNITILTLSGTRYMTVDTLTLRTISNTAGIGIMFRDTAQHDSIKRCFIDLRSLDYNTSSYSGGISFTDYYNNSFTRAANTYIGYNYILGTTGDGGANFGIGDPSYAGYYSTADSGNVIEYNTIENFYYTGIQVFASGGTRVAYNNIHCTNKTSSGYFIGIRCYSGWNSINPAGSYNVQVIGNRIHNPPTGNSGINAFVGIQVDNWYYYNNQNSNGNVLIANNAIYNINSATSNTIWGIYYGGGYGNIGAAGDTVRIYHNTIDINNASTGTISGIYLNNYYYNNNQQGNDVLLIKNNLITMSSTSGTRYGLWYYDYQNQNPFLLDVQRNNVYFSTPASNQYFCSYNNTNYLTAANFQAAFPGQEVGTISVNPQYSSPATGDLTPLNLALSGNGVNLLSVVPKDILGRSRSTAPVPGAFELAVDAGVDALISPVGTYCSSVKLVQVSVHNMGIVPINTLQVNWSLNGVLQPPVSYTGTLAPNGNAVISLGNGLFMPASPVTIKAWTSMPNGQSDGIPANDTLEITTQSSTSVPVDIGPDDTICTGTTLTLDAGYPGATYRWDNMATTQYRTIQYAGTYYVRVTALDGCIGVDTMKLSLRELPVVDLGPSREICWGTTTTFDAGHPGSTYLWDDGSVFQTRTVDTAGYYEVQVTDEHGCTGVGNVSVGMKDLPYVDGINATHADSGLYTFYPLNPRYAISYRWNFGDGSPEEMGYMVQHQYQRNDIYTVTLYLEGECTGLIINNKRTVDVFNARGEGGSTGIGNIDPAGNIAIYPNPASDRLTIENLSEAHMQRISVYNVLGQVILSEETDSDKRHELRTSGLASGLYTLRIETDKGSYSQKFEIKR